MIGTRYTTMSSAESAALVSLKMHILERKKSKKTTKKVATHSVGKTLIFQSSTLSKWQIAWGENSIVSCHSNGMQIIDFLSPSGQDKVKFAGEMTGEFFHQRKSFLALCTTVFYYGFPVYNNHTEQNIKFPIPLWCGLVGMNEVLSRDNLLYPSLGKIKKKIGIVRKILL